MKDLFSQHSSAYARFRPSYPPEVLAYVMSFVKNRDSAWDCGTGNGQLATILAPFFKTVQATDISSEQILHAPRLENIIYQIAKAEAIIFPPKHFDLITVGQAIHWFNFEQFYEAVRFTLKPGGIIAVLGYGLLEVPGEVNVVINHLYRDVLGKYWDQERHYLDASYTTIPFPFEEIKTDHVFAERSEWKIDQLIGYLNTWSAVKHYEKVTGKNPLTELADQFEQAWGAAATRPVIFPTLLRIGVCN